VTHTGDRTRATDGAAGFSLVELVIAMTVTLIITGAVFQLVTAGQTAFRKEPELADRQQNIRVGMDLISQDLYRAGYGVPQFAQVFTDNLNAVGPMGSGGQATDEIEIFLASDCPSVPVCGINTQGTGASVTTKVELDSCYQFPSLVILGDEEKWGLFWAKAPGAATSGSCPGGSPGAKNGHVNLPHGQAPLVNPPGGLGGWIPDYMLVGQAVRYRVQMDADGIPNLERSAYGGQVMPDGSSSWQIVARGVEDLQVEYENGIDVSGTPWHDLPGVITCGANCAAPTQADYDTLIRRVRVRLSARATGGGNLTGQTTSAVGNAVRGQLMTEIAPRAAVASLGMAAGDI
jgi:Tfp pilus assembly protein PilW